MVLSLILLYIFIFLDKDYGSLNLVANGLIGIMASAEMFEV
jgi:hypothetical protein